MRPLPALLLALVLVFLIAPMLVAASVSFTSDQFLTFPPRGFSWRWYAALGADPKWRAALADTLLIGALCTAIATTIGTLSAYGISHIKRSLPRNAVLVVFLAPLVVPYIAFGMALYPVFAEYRLIGTHLGIAAAQAVISIPFVVITILSTIRRRDRTLEHAARTLGAGPWRAFRHVALPLMLPGILAGVVIAFMTSFDDVVMPLFLSGADISTVPKTMFNSVALSSDPSVMAASTVISTFGLLAYLAVVVVRRRGGAMPWRRSGRERPERRG